MKKYDVIIIGGGVVGLSTAYYLGKSGQSVLVLDKGNGTDGCSFGNAGFISPSHFVPLSAPGIVAKGLRWMMSRTSPFYIKPRLNKELLKWGWEFVKHATPTHVDYAKDALAELSLLSRTLHNQLANEANMSIQNKGMLMLCRDEATLAHEIEVAEMAKQWDMGAKAYTPEELKKVEPGMKLNVLGGVMFPLDSYTDPAAFMQQLPKLFNALPITLAFSKEVTDFTLSKGTITGVTAGQAHYQADNFVLATGSFAPRLMKKLNLNLPLEAGKGYSVDWTTPTSVPTTSYILAEARVAVTPMPGRVRLAGTMELVGLNESINKTRANGFLQSIEAYLPEYTFDKLKNLPVWAGLRPCSPDGLPFIGRNKQFKNLILATGHAMMGFTLGPATGLLVKEIILEEKNSVAINKFEPNRY